MVMYRQRFFSIFMSSFIPVSLATCLQALSAPEATRQRRPPLVFEYAPLHPVLSPTYVLPSHTHGHNTLRSLAELMRQADGADLVADPDPVIPNECATETMARGDTTCCICYEAYDPSDAVSRLQCAHAFHTSCVNDWFQHSSVCPLCRAVQADTM